MDKKACIKRDNQTWSMTYRVSEDGLSVLVKDFNAEDGDGYLFYNNLPKINQFNFDMNRRLSSVKIDDAEYIVENPEPLSAYKQPM